MGPWTARASEWFGVPLPVHPLKGQIIRLQAPGAPYALSVGHLGNYAMTKPSDGLVWCGTTEEHADFDESRTTEGARCHHRVHAADAAVARGRGTSCCRPPACAP